MLERRTLGYNVELYQQLIPELALRSLKTLQTCAKTFKYWSLRSAIGWFWNASTTNQWNLFWHYFQLTFGYLRGTNRHLVLTRKLKSRHLVVYNGHYTFRHSSCHRSREKIYAYSRPIALQYNKTCVQIYGWYKGPQHRIPSYQDCWSRLAPN